jgi:hypothetical protein
LPQHDHACPSWVVGQYVNTNVLLLFGWLLLCLQAAAIQ